MVGYGVGVGLKFAKGIVSSTSPGGLVPLTLSNYEFPENAAPGTVIATIYNRSAGSTLSVSPADGRFAISGNNLVVGLTVSPNGDYPIGITETLGDISLLSEMTLRAVSSITFDSTHTRADSTRTDGGLEIRSTLQNWNLMLASLAARRGA